MEDSDTGEVYLRATMPKMAQEIKEAYANAMDHLAKQAKTPGFPGKCLKKAMEDKAEMKTMEYHVLHDEGWTGIGQCCERTDWTDG